MSADKAAGAVLLVAHGSRVPASNAEIEALAARLARRLGPDVMVTHAFLELASPAIPDAIDELAGRGARRIVLIPYFLSAGRHVGEDIPAIVADARRRHPALEMEITTHFGAVSAVPELLAGMVTGH
ncbi:MAG: CbiX/SirB N-terminal domain-containing protein [Gammaproteobacteria bacterium]|nr:CbiX/SirB N-terminal domain-containing protein [Gammaproteobacteria bacterium]